MDEGLKKRLVGATVLASLVVIFVPMLIDDPDTPDSELKEIPSAPPAKDFASSMLSQEVVRPEPLPVREPEPEPEPVHVELADKTPPMTSPEPATKPKPAPATSKAPDPKPGLTAWVVKVGSFSNRENASALVKKLRAAGFQTPDAERVELGGKVLYRVKVGPMVRKEKAEKLLPEINKISGTEGQVARFQ